MTNSLGMELGIHKMSLEHPVVPESKEGLGKKKKRWSHVKGTQQSPQGPDGQSWNDLKKKIVLDYNSKYKISIQVHTGINK